MSQIQRRTEAAEGCRETSGSASRTGQTELEQRHNTHQSQISKLVFLNGLFHLNQFNNTVIFQGNKGTELDKFK